MELTNDTLYNALLVLGAEVKKSGTVVTMDEQYNYLLVSVTGLPPDKNKPSTVSIDKD